jgi:hypothetical protein
MSTLAPPRGPTRTRRALTGGFLALAVAGSMTAVLVSNEGRAGAAGPVGTVAALPASETAGRGATLPFVEHEAENVTTTGTIIGPNRAEGTLAGEASGRKAVSLGAGQFVEFTLTAPANSIVARVSIPDSAGGTGLDGSLALSVNGAAAGTLPVTSRYGWYYGSYPFTNSPGAGRPHHFYDESRKLLGQTFPVGTKVRLAYGASNIPAYTVDLADFENVAAAGTQPANSISITANGADPNGAGDSAGAIDTTVAQAKAQAKTVWIPAGTFTVNRHIILDGVTVKGAGPWYSVLHGNGVGIYGRYVVDGGPSQNVHVSDFAVIGEVQERNDADQVNGVGGALSNSSVSNLWIQHTKVGAWMDGPFTNFTFSGNRVLDQTADGLNLHDGITSSTVSNNFIRNTGDDGLALWAEHNQESGDSFTHNTVIAPILANNIAIYGGSGITVSDNVVADTQTQGGGLHFANRFSAVPVAGTFTVANNTTVRAGVLDPNWQFGVGSIWFDGRDGPMTNTINVSALRLIDNSYEGIQFIDSSVTGVHFDGVSIEGAGTFALQLQGVGSASFRNVVAAGLGKAGTYNCMGPNAFAIQDLGGNAGWSDVYCGPWPDPVYGTPTVPPTPPPTGPTAPPPTTTPPPPPANGNLAQGKPITATGFVDVDRPQSANDGSTTTYWESTNNTFPQSITVDLGAATSINHVTLRLPPSWEARTQTLSVTGSTDGTAFTGIVGSGAVRFDPATGDNATLNFAATSTRFVRVTVTANTGWPAGQLAELEVYAGGTATTPPPPPPPPPTGDLARGHLATSSSFTDVDRPANLTDGDANTYWESVNNVFPQWAQVDLGSAQTVGRLVLKLPPPAAWAARNQTLSIAGSTDGTTFSTILGSAVYRFDPATGNTVTITVPSGSRRFVRVDITANTGWPAGQLSSLEVYAS